MYMYTHTHTHTHTHIHTHTHQVIGPVFDKLAEETPQAVFVKVDVDQCRSTATKYKVCRMYISRNMYIVRVFVCVYMCVCMCVCVHVYMLYVSLSLYIYTYIYIHIVYVRQG